MRSLCQLACILEVMARKPGNVHPLRRFADVACVDFLLSAAAVGDVLEQSRELGVGRAVLAGVQETRRVVATNTNLGILLLLAPLAAVPPGIPLESGIHDVLDRLTVEDARHVYAAIRLANPGGLGRVEDQDVHDEPTVTLLEAMKRAAERDLVARQYAQGFVDVFTCGVPALAAGLGEGLSIEDTIILCHLWLLARNPDTLIRRKLGLEEAEEASRRADHVLSLGWPRRPEGQEAVLELDAWLRARGNQRNPGATADLVTASLFVALREGTMQLPFDRPWTTT